MSKEYKTGSVTVTVDYSYDVHSITFSKRTWDRIDRGFPISIKGQGFNVEGLVEQDVWTFNDQTRGARVVEVTTDEGREVFCGSLDDEEVSVVGA